MYSMNRLSSFRELLNKPTGIYNVNGLNIKWDLEYSTWQPNDIVSLLCTLPKNATIYNMVHHLKEELFIIDDYYNRFNFLSKKKDLDLNEYAELINLQNFFLKAKDSIYNTDEKVIKILSQIA